MKKIDKRMKRLCGKRSLMLLFCALAFFLSGCVDRQVRNIESRGKNIICFGDSVTAGYGVEKGQEYPTILARMVISPVINAGLDGDTAVEAVKRLGTDVLAKDPLLVIIEFGGNDFLSKTPLSETISSIEAMIQKTLAKGAMVAVADISTNLIMEDYGKEIKKLCKKHGAIFIPKLFNGIITNPALKSDFIHPNKTGYQVIAHRVYRAVIPYLNRNSILKRFKEDILK